MIFAYRSSLNMHILSFLESLVTLLDVPWDLIFLLQKLSDQNIQTTQFTCRTVSTFETLSTVCMTLRRVSSEGQHHDVMQTWSSRRPFQMFKIHEMDLVSLSSTLAFERSTFFSFCSSYHFSEITCLQALPLKFPQAMKWHRARKSAFGQCKPVHKVEHPHFRRTIEVDCARTNKRWFLCDKILSARPLTQAKALVNKCKMRSGSDWVG